MLISIFAHSLGFHASILKENRPFLNEASVALNLLVSLFGLFVARGGSNRRTDRQTDTQTKYCNPRCACAPKVNQCHSVELLVDCNTRIQTHSITANLANKHIESEHR